MPGGVSTACRWCHKHTHQSRGNAQTSSPAEESQKTNPGGGEATARPIGIGGAVPEVRSPGRRPAAPVPARVIRLVVPDDSLAVHSDHRTRAALSDHRYRYAPAHRTFVFDARR